MRFEAKKAAAKRGTKNAKSSKRSGRKAAPSEPLFSLTADQWLDIVGAVLIAVAIITLLSALSPGGQGAIMGAWFNFLRTAFGWMAFAAPVVLAAFGYYLIQHHFDNLPRIGLGRVFGLLALFFSLLMGLHVLGMLGGQPDGARLAAESGGGGSTGWALLRLFIAALGQVGAIFATLALIALSLLMATGLTFAHLVDAARRIAQRQPGRASVGSPASRETITPSWDTPRRPAKPAAGDAAPDLVINGLKTRRGKEGREPKVKVPLAPEPAPPRARASAQGGDADLPPARVIGTGRAAPKIPVGATPAVGAAAPSTTPPPLSSRYDSARVWELPAITGLLEQGKDATLQESDIRKKAAVIEDTLRSFGVPGRVTEVNRGPTITQFGVEPGFTELKNGKQQKVKVSRIAGLADDLALALSAPRIRIEAPVPGRAIVGIEVPNGETSLVSLRDILESEDFETLARKTRLRLALGADVSGHPVVADLTAMPHLLIAGTTGSGKSVCVNGIIAALLMYNAPDTLRFLMVDPKRVELTGYNGIPHLISPVVVDVEKVIGVLKWVTSEMDNRYRTFARHGCRNVLDFNAKAEEGRLAAAAAGTPVDPDFKQLPYIVVVIDELADLMMLAPDETEKMICRLAQMARATGIHLIIATQRPSVDVVTGLIKANFPARIAFTVATAVDSRVIIDQPGADKLLGRGDMLVMTPESALPMRAQGCFVGDKEINKIVRHWRAQGGGGEEDPVTPTLEAPEAPVAVAAGVFSPPPPVGGPLSWDEARALSTAITDVGKGGNGSNADRLFEDAVETVRLQGKASISLLQRRLRIGYTRAARLIEEMEEKGIVGPSVPGSQFREVLGGGPKFNA
ncbi:MAG: DNA translocase FtsK [Thermoflexales bacterium]|nr:DNA translocase FtsK [Thermoflexales bacterium]